MSHPPETSLELAQEICSLCPTATFNHDEVTTLIDAWVREREVRLSDLIERWRKPVASSTTQNEAVYNHCADDLESALATARKQLDEEKGEPHEETHTRKVK